MNVESRVILIVGCQRTGTTLLASMIGRHSEINMLFESTGKDVFRLIGKTYCGNKLLAYRQVRVKSRASKFGFLMNRLANFDIFPKRRSHKLRPFPTSRLTIEDYETSNTFFITIERDKDSAVSSMMNRAGQSIKQAEKEWDKSSEIIKYIKKNPCSYSVQFTELVQEPERILREICEFLDLEYEAKMMDGPKFNFVYPSKGVIAKES